MALTRDQLVTRIVEVAYKDKAFERFFRGNTISQVRLVVNVILRARAIVAKEVATEGQTVQAPQGRVLEG